MTFYKHDKYKIAASNKAEKRRAEWLFILLIIENIYTTALRVEPVGSGSENFGYDEL
jgi:hypothetical protein